MTNPSEEFFAVSERDHESALLTDLKAMVRRHAYSHPRSQQIALGPSQIGHPCARNVISGIIGSGGSSINPQGDPLPSYIGTAAHKAMEEAAKLDNTRRLIEGSTERWIPERKVDVTEGLSGTCDLYDIDTDTVIDYKFPGTTKMAQYRKEGPSVLYRVQAHLYGKGYLNAGYPVKRVGIWFLPRSGYLSSSKLWIEDYSEDLVQEQLSRWWSLILLLDELRIEDDPKRLALIPITPYECHWCPWFSVVSGEDNPFACAGGVEYQPKISDHSGMRPV